RPPGNLAAAQQALSDLAAPALLRAHAPSPAALNAARNVLEAQAQFDGPQRKVSVRLAEHDGLTISIWRMSSGVASKSAPTDGGSPRTPRSDSAAAPACSRFRSRCGADQLRRSPRL